MNKLFQYIISLTVILSVASCDNNITDEQFIKKVSLTKNGFQIYNIEFTDDDIVDLSIPLNINGTSKNTQDVYVKLTLDKDTLDGYNFERFRDKEVLYYLALEEKMYSFPNGPETTIPAGEDYGVIPLRINLNTFDLYNNYILPLRIENVSTYDISQNKYSKMLINFNIRNFFSGAYSVSGNVWENSTPAEKLPIISKTFFTLGSNCCWLYMGDVDENNNLRSEYTMTVTVNKEIYEDRVDDMSGANIRRFTKVTLDTRNMDKKLNSEGSAWMEQELADNPYDNKLQNLQTRIYLKYSYLDLSTPNYPVKKFFEGLLSHTQTVDKKTGEIIN